MVNLIAVESVDKEREREKRKQLRTRVSILGVLVYTHLKGRRSHLDQYTGFDKVCISLIPFWYIITLKNLIEDKRYNKFFVFVLHFLYTP